MCWFAAPAAAGAMAAAEVGLVAAGGMTAGTAAVATPTLFGIAGAPTAATFGSIMQVGQLAGVGMQAFSAMQASDANARAAEYQAAVDRNNATYAEWQAQDAIERGNTAVSEKTRQASALKGTQTASMAARGLDLSEGTPLNIMTDTDIMMQQDVDTIKSNAAREAWGMRVRGSNSAANASMLMRKAENENPWLIGGGTLLSGLGSVSDRWYARNKL